ncbi:uncharacterized protein LACBIDRAFT_326593 [Laccaria bicolor S238N-H82]|uniref:Predicted protein n=1 Tax=Laccaria bicolor (strain S238N-H82 / ATCC MYA-4686) TaxID=486041 RepID=B0D955_LACBS|nr:uncharacterized protein LACBIDRAFT_326593 [Laccaria bicolor S238N-H82]EDR09194.1 predicted protein [Laccaria bicolor S238N-H82]|eukprot:XP_001880507.1 predicted protein [Laccaria bicolor S238N-H82]
MLASIVRWAVLCTVSWGCWSVVRRFMVGTALDNIPGPPSLSFFKGNLSQLFNTHGWEFHKAIAAKYGSVIKLKALFGENQLYVFDPKALHHIVVKDQHIYEETTPFIE